MEDPTDQPILQDHDRYTLTKTIQYCRGLPGVDATDRKRPREGAG